MRHAGIARCNSEIRELQRQAVELVIDFYQATLEIEGSAQVWGKNWIASLPSSRKAKPGPKHTCSSATMRELVNKGATILSDRGWCDCNCVGFVKPEDKRSSYTLWA